MGVLPAGASSVFARQLGFHTDPVAAAEQLAAAIRDGSTRKVGLGVAGRPPIHVRRRPRPRRRGDGDRRPGAARAARERAPRRSARARDRPRRAAQGGLRAARAHDAAHGRRRAPLLVSGRRQPESVHVPRADPRAGRSAGRLRARPGHRLHPRAARPRPVAPAGVRADLAAPRRVGGSRRSATSTTCTGSPSSATSRPPSSSTASTWATSTRVEFSYRPDAIEVFVPPEGS